MDEEQSTEDTNNIETDGVPNVPDSGQNANTTPDGNDDSSIVTLSSDDEEPCINPEPPRELVEKQLLGADTIGDTVFSKHWLFTTLMKLIEAVDKEQDVKDTNKDSESGIDLEDSLQDELCKLWDMSMNPAVVTFLMEFKAIDLLSGVISRSKAPRAIEICVGILGNMACTQPACLALSQDEKIRSLALLLLSSPDPPTLVETTRLVNICVMSPGVSELWLNSIQQTPTVFESLKFMLQSSTNVDLLTNVADVLDKTMDMSDLLLVQWSTEDLVQAILEAAKQCKSRKDAIDTFLHILQLVSTCETGVEALGHHSEPLCQLTLEYLVQLCAEDIVVLAGQEDSVGSALSVLATSFTALDDKSSLLSKDFQMIRCLLKLLSVVYPKMRSFTPEVRTQRSRSDSHCSVGKGQSSKTSSDHLKSGQGDLDSKPQTSSCDKPEMSVDDQNQETGTLDDPIVVSDSVGNSCDSTEKGVVGSANGKDRTSPVGDRGVTEMLYEVLQNILTDLVLVISEEEGLIYETSTNDESDSSNQQTETTKEKPKTLTYLNDHCDRQRIRMLVHTLDEVFEDTELDCNTRLRQVAHDHGLSRLESIVEEYSAG